MLMKLLVGPYIHEYGDIFKYRVESGLEVALCINSTSRCLMFIWNYLVCHRPPSLGLHLSLPLSPSCLAFNTVPAWFLWNPRRLWSCSSTIKIEAQNRFWSIFVLRNMQMNCEQSPLCRHVAEPIACCHELVGGYGSGVIFSAYERAKVDVSFPGLVPSQFNLSWFTVVYLTF